MKMTKHSLQIIGGKTYICLDANEVCAVVVPLDLENAVLYDQQSLRVIGDCEVVPKFEPSPVENVLLDPDLFIRHKYD